MEERQRQGALLQLSAPALARMVRPEVLGKVALVVQTETTLVLAAVAAEVDIMVEAGDRDILQMVQIYKVEEDLLLYQGMLDALQ